MSVAGRVEARVNYFGGGVVEGRLGWADSRVEDHRLPVPRRVAQLCIQAGDEGSEPERRPGAPRT